MTDQEILEAATRKAVDKGWRPSYLVEPIVAGVSFEDYKRRIRFGSISEGETMAVEEVIFNHDFARALWGEEPVDPLPHLREIIPEGWTSYAPLPAYKYHLGQMVIAEEPLAYLGVNG